VAAVVRLWRLRPDHEASFATPPATLIKRLTEWHANWSGEPGVCAALQRDSCGCCIPTEWQVRVWLFVPAFNVNYVLQRREPLRALRRPRITPLEMVQPCPAGAVEVVPEEMRT
jgi:hypothetical protein